MLTIYCITTCEGLTSVLKFSMLNTSFLGVKIALGSSYKTKVEQKLQYTALWNSTYNNLKLTEHFIGKTCSDINEYSKHLKLKGCINTF